MRLGFEELQASYTSGSQSARAWTETWVKAWTYCPHCGSARMSSTQAFEVPIVTGHVHDRVIG
ncbi:DpnI domain-containing protein [Bradyrhizobium sp. I1.14.4]|uniref:DpnI domain-containing protein n=1 Tax=unclassified Bradyrhizobium TaxID=2631580 RepID=UPI003D1A6CAB